MRINLLKTWREFLYYILKEIMSEFISVNMGIGEWKLVSFFRYFYLGCDFTGACVFLQLMSASANISITFCSVLCFSLCKMKVHSRGNVCGLLPITQRRIAMYLSYNSAANFKSIGLIQKNYNQFTERPQNGNFRILACKLPHHKIVLK